MKNKIDAKKKKEQNNSKARRLLNLKVYKTYFIAAMCSATALIVASSIEAT